MIPVRSALSTFRPTLRHRFKVPDKGRSFLVRAASIGPSVRQDLARLFVPGSVVRPFHLDIRPIQDLWGIRTPQTTAQHKYQFRDDFSWHVTGKGGFGHDMKAGANFIHEPKLYVTFSSGSADYAYTQKYGFRDYRGGGRSSAR